MIMSAAPKGTINVAGATSSVSECAVGIAAPYPNTKVLITCTVLGSGTALGVSSGRR